MSVFLTLMLLYILRFLGLIFHSVWLTAFLSLMGLPLNEKLNAKFMNIKHLSSALMQKYSKNCIDRFFHQAGSTG